MSFPPQLFGRYYVYDKLAVGGMAEIFKAKLCGEHSFQKTIIIKRLLQSKQQKQYENLFIDEAHLSASLMHPNIVQTHDFSVVDDRYFIAMEYVEGQDLKRLLIRLSEERKHLPIDLALFIGHEICAALEYIHQKSDPSGNSIQLIHRDLSPANILLGYDGTVKLTDFGIAKFKNRLYKSNPGTIKGKYEYMSPEQAFGREIDHRSDLYSLGILLYEMLTGRRLFKSNTDTEALERVKTGTIPNPEDINPRISSKLSQLLSSALNKNVALRFQSATDMRQAILQALHPHSINALSEELKQRLDELFTEEKEEEKREEQKVFFDLKDLFDKQNQHAPNPKDAPKGFLQHESPAAETEVVIETVVEYSKIWIWISIFFAVTSVIFFSLWVLEPHKVIELRNETFREGNHTFSSTDCTIKSNKTDVSIILDFSDCKDSK